jgi:hypothetical protein
MIKDALQDLIKYVHGVGVFPALHITQTAEGMNISSAAADKTAVVQAETALKIGDGELVYGLGQLELLDYLLKCPEYKENEKITLVNDDDGKLSKVVFTNAAGDFTNSYRFMSQTLVETLVKAVKLKDVAWTGTCTPPVASIQRFNMQASANSSEQSFMLKSDADKLVITFGTPATHGGSFTFATGASGKVNGVQQFPVAVFQKILNLSANAKTTTMKVADGIMCFELDSGLVKYNFYIMALSK